MQRNIVLDHFHVLLNLIYQFYDTYPTKIVTLATIYCLKPLASILWLYYLLCILRYADWYMFLNRIQLLHDIYIVYNTGLKLQFFISADRQTPLFLTRSCSLSRDSSFQALAWNSELNTRSWRASAPRPHAVSLGYQGVNLEYRFTHFLQGNLKQFRSCLSVCEFTLSLWYTSNDIRIQKSRLLNILHFLIHAQKVITLLCVRHNTHPGQSTQIAKFIGPTWDPPGSCRSQMGPMLAPCYHGRFQMNFANILL